MGFVCVRKLLFGMGWECAVMTNNYPAPLFAFTEMHTIRATVNAIERSDVQIEYLPWRRLSLISLGTWDSKRANVALCNKREGFMADIEMLRKATLPCFAQLSKGFINLRSKFAFRNTTRSSRRAAASKHAGKIRNNPKYAFEEYNR